MSDTEKAAFVVKALKDIEAEQRLCGRPITADKTAEARSIIENYPDSCALLFDILQSCGG